MPFVAAGAVTGIGSLPLTSITSAIRSVAEFSREVPFWPQLPQLSERESVVCQGLGVVEELIEPRNVVREFTDAVSDFLSLTQMEYRSHPNSHRRIATSLTS